ncbi:MAG: hypothetical protein A2W05_02285 [Candidatus Schekmanbacteria bacterium RBG_16_38_10]|uniref:Cysteine-rich domain-containing protein n=1 Tax=Candidatus Schekmanbacteria bacterium RBG_16_38_10 TaxID=1817879 RepID=A0A1F7RN27_9BACT|nr:MAG: hypothetical protein A2W05_02285 [Candidatus Schekmanbacteria bacterium RBG_16_38_10]
MEFGLFLGCTVPARARQYEMSTRKIAEKLGITFVDIGEFSCCGFPLKAVSKETALLLAARNLSLAEERGVETICSICSACTENLTEMSRELNEDENLREEVNKKLKEINRQYKGGVKVKHIGRILYEDIGIEKIKKTVTRELKNISITPHYGCHYVRPSKIYDKFDDPEIPKSLEELIKVTGANYVSHQNGMLCCGGGILAIADKVSLALSKEKLDRMKESGADAICLVCPFCSVMYDGNQRSIEELFQTKYELPVLFYPQLLGLAMGIDSKELGLQLNVVKTKGLLEKIGT